MPSIRSQLFKLYFRLRNQRLALDRPVEEQRRNLDRLGARLPLPKGAAVHRFDLDGVPAEWIDTPGVFPDRVLLEATLEKAREIARWPVRALQATKRCLRAVHAEGIRVARAAEDAGMVDRAGSPENVEAIRAFLEKREPDFRKFRPR